MQWVHWYRLATLGMSVQCPPCTLLLTMHCSTSGFAVSCVPDVPPSGLLWFAEEVLFWRALGMSPVGFPIQDVLDMPQWAASVGAELPTGADLPVVMAGVHVHA